MTKPQLKRKIVDMKGNKCYDCGGVFPDYCYDLDHRDPAQKTFNQPRISQTLREIYG